MKKILILILCFILIIAAVLYGIDHRRMSNNEPVLFSTWGAKYAPPLENFSSVMCSALGYRNSKDGAYLEIVLDDEKSTKKTLAIKNEALIDKMSEISIERIIGVNLAAKIPDSVFGNLSDYYRVYTTQLLIDCDDYDKYFEIVDVSLSDMDY